jgi:hypothetical protein
MREGGEEGEEGVTAVEGEEGVFAVVEEDDDEPVEVRLPLHPFKQCICI